MRAKLRFIFANSNQNSFFIYSFYNLPICLNAVSYTHLDVYKRQDLFYLYSPSGSLYDDLRIYLSAVTIYLRYLVARYCHS